MKIVCPHCNFSKEIDASKLPPEAKKATCPKCKEKFDINPEEMSAPPPPETFEEETISIKERYRPEPDMETEAMAASLVDSKPESKPSQPPPMPTGSSRTRTAPPPPARDGQNIAWETRTGGFFGDLWATTKHVLFKPGDFFASMPITGGHKAPLIFGLFWGTLGFLIFIGWMAVLMTTVLEMFFSYMGEMDASINISQIQYSMIGSLLGTIIFIPVNVLINLYLGAAILFLLLLIVRGANGGFEATFRVLAYASSAQLFNIIPVIGMVFGGIWSIVLIVIGLAKANNTSVGRVLLAVLVIPLVLVFGFGIVMAVIIPLLIGA